MTTHVVVNGELRSAHMYMGTGKMPTPDEFGRLWDKVAGNLARQRAHDILVAARYGPFFFEARDRLHRKRRRK